MRNHESENLRSSGRGYVRIRVLCGKEELERIDEIQDTLSPIMKRLADLGLRGEITIEEAEAEKEYPGKEHYKQYG